MLSLRSTITASACTSRWRFTKPLQIEAAIEQDQLGDEYISHAWVVSGDVAFDAMGSYPASDPRASFAGFRNTQLKQMTSAELIAAMCPPRVCPERLEAARAVVREHFTETLAAYRKLEPLPSRQCKRRERVLIPPGRQGLRATTRTGPSCRCDRTQRRPGALLGRRRASRRGDPDTSRRKGAVRHPVARL